MAEQQRDQAAGRFGPGQANEPGEGEVEGGLAGERPGDGVPEGGERGAPALQQQRRQDDPGEELGRASGLATRRRACRENRTSESR